MQLSANDWRVHARSARDLADRMLVRGDTKGAEAMLLAARDLEKRHMAAIKAISFYSMDRMVGSFDDLQSPDQSSLQFSATILSEPADKAVSDTLPASARINDTRYREISSQPSLCIP